MHLAPHSGANIRNVNSHVVKNYVESKKYNLEYRFLKPKYPFKINAILQDSNGAFFLLIPILLPMPVSTVIWINWACLPMCTGKLLLNTRLESLTPFLKLCETSSTHVDQLLPEVRT